MANVSNSPPKDDGIEVDMKEVKFIESCGKKLAATELLWLPENLEGDIFDADIDDSYNGVDRFSNEPGDQPKNKIQRALRDVQKVVPGEYWDKEDFSGWIPAAVRVS